MLSRSFLPSWIATAVMIGLQLIFVGVYYDPLEPRPLSWSPDGATEVAIVLCTAIAWWAYPAHRAVVCLVAALCAMTVALHALSVPYEAPISADELFLYYTLAAVLLALGTVQLVRDRNTVL